MISAESDLSNLGMRARLARRKRRTLQATVFILIACIPLRWMWAARQVSKNKALLAAVETGNLSAVKALLRSGADANFRDYGYYQAIDEFVCRSSFDPDACTPLITAAEEGRIDIAKVLIHNGAYIDAEYKEGGTALNWAKVCGNAEMVRYLISRGANQSIHCKSCSLKRAA